MKTSVIEVHDMVSVWNVDETEKRIGEVPGVESVTVNFAAGRATVRYDETRLDLADIKSAVRQRGYESAEKSVDSTPSGHDLHAAPRASPPPLGQHAPEPSPDAATAATAAAEKHSDNGNEAVPPK
jgi:Cu2+-exporting ATPase